MATGQWRPRSNIQLIQTVKDPVTQVAGLRSLQWRRVYGHTGVTTKEPIATRTGELEAHKWAKVRLVRRPAQLSSTSSTPAVADGTPGPTAKMSWSEFSSVLINAVDATAGRSQRKKLASFYTDADRDEIQRLMMQHTQVWQKLKLSRGLPREAALRHELHSIKDSIRRYKQASRDRWVLDVVHTLEQAVAIHDIKQFYNTLPKFGIHAAEGHSKEGKEPFTPQEALDHLDAVMNHALPVAAETLEALPRRVPQSEHLAQLPDRAEVQDALADLRESAPGLDEITVLMLRLSGELGIQIITNLMPDLWQHPEQDWDPLLHKAVGVLLRKRKGNRDDLNQYRLIVLLSIASRPLAKIIANRLREHVERAQLLPEYQWGFRPRRCTLDGIFTLRVLMALRTEVLQHGGLPPAEHDALACIFSWTLRRPTVPYLALRHGTCYSMLVICHPIFGM